MKRADWFKRVRGRMRFFSVLPAGCATFALVLGMGSSLAFVKPAEPELPNFDRRELGAAPAAAAAEPAVAKLKSMAPRVKVDFDERLGTPKWIRRPEGFLSGAEAQPGAISPQALKSIPPTDPYRATKAFVREHYGLFRFGPEILEAAPVRREFVTAHSGLRTVVWEQQLDGIRIFEAVFISHTTERGDLVSLSSQFIAEPANAADAGTPDRAKAQVRRGLTAREALASAAENLEVQLAPEEAMAAEAPSLDPAKRHLFKAPGLSGVAQAELVWLPMNADHLRLCWEVLLSSRVRSEGYRLLVDAATGEVLIRHRLTSYLTPRVYRVFTSDSPTPFSPGCDVPCFTVPPSASRVLAPGGPLDPIASPAGWSDSQFDETRGNNVDAHTDKDANDLPDLPRPHASPTGEFDFPLDLTQEPDTYSDASVVQLFYWNNWMHDRLYGLGFTEGAGNFQNDNFGRGGLGNDAVQADAQDGSGSNNANFTAWPDGTRGRMQMYIFTGPTPNRDGSLDAQVVLHEYTHGLSNRRVGGGIGLNTAQGWGMGEGWSDFYALALLSEPGDDIDGTYAAGAYSSYLMAGSGLVQNYYYGIRRYPYSTRLENNPLTLKDIDPINASAHTDVPRSPGVGVFISTRAEEVHNMGEVWCVTLWEARANLIRKHGFEAGNELILRLVTDGMNLSPANPDFLQARDAILLADRVLTSGANQNELWAAFARRGMGYSATVPWSTSTIGVREAFDLPDTLEITPAGCLVSSGPVGGPFTVLEGTFTLVNHDTNTVTWSAARAADWIDLAPASGVLEAGGTAVVTVSLNQAAATLSQGLFKGSIQFSNQTSARVQTRQFVLRVGQPQVLLLVDTLLPSPYEPAMINRGYSYVVFTNQSVFNDALTLADPVFNVAIVESSKNSAELTRLSAFVEAGGRALLQYWNLDNNLAATFQATVAQTISSPLPVYDWGGSTCFNGISSPVAIARPQQLGRNGQKLQALPGAQALAGFTNLANPTLAALVLGNGGRTLLQGFFIEHVILPDAAQKLARNELDLLVPVPPAAPFMTLQPQSQTVLTGATAIFKAGAGGSLPQSFQWYREGSQIAGATDTVYTILAVQAADAGGYWMVASNAYGAAQSAPAILTVTNSNPVGTILFFSDVTDSPYELALRSLGLSYVAYNNISLFDSGLSHAGLADALAIVDSCNYPMRSPALESFAQSGGRAILQYWGLAGGTALAAAFGVSVAATNSTPPWVYKWDSSKFFAGVTVPITFGDQYIVDGQRLQPTGAGLAVAGYTLAPASNQAAIVVGNSGRTIVNGFMAEEFARPDEALQFARNQIRFFLPQTDGLVIAPEGNATVSGPVGGPLTTNSATFKASNEGLGSLEWSVWTAVPWLSLDIGGGLLDAGEIASVTASLSSTAGELAAGIYSGTIWFSNHVSGTKQFRQVNLRVGQPQFLLLADTLGPSIYETALKNRGYPCVVFASLSEFDFALRNADPAYDIAIVHNTLRSGLVFSNLANFAQAGGRVLLQSWNLQSSAAAAVFGVNVAGQVISAKPVYDWGGSPCLDSLPGPVPMTTSLLSTHGQLLQALTGATAVAGYTPEVQAGQAALVLAKSGRTLVQGFYIDDVSSPADAFLLAANEIELLLGEPAVAPFIAVQPRSQKVLFRATATLQAGCGGSLPLSYQWLHKGIEIPGATASRYLVANMKPSLAGEYRLRVVNAHGNVTSEPAVLTLGNALDAVTSTFVLHDIVARESPYTNALSTLGMRFWSTTDDAAFNRAVEAADPFKTLVIVDSIQAYHDLSELGTFVRAGGRALMQYWHADRDLLAAFNAVATMTNRQPAAVYDWGNSDFFTGVAIPLKFLPWYAIEGLRFEPAPGGTGMAGYTLGPMQGQAALVLGNSGRTILNGVPLEVAEDPGGALQLALNELRLFAPPQFLKQPSAQRAITGEPVSFVVEASGTAPVSFQWRKDGKNLADGGKLSGVTSSRLSIMDAQAADMGGYTVLARTPNGSIESSNAVLTVWPLLAWGDNSAGQTKIPAGLAATTKIAAGAIHNLALKADGTVAAWGAGVNGAANSAFTGAAQLKSLSKIVDITAGSYHSLALKSDGTVAAWGAGMTNSGIAPDFGQALVPSGLSNVTQIAGGFAHSLALKSDGTVVAWGAGGSDTGLAPEFGQSIVPAGLFDVVAVAASGYQSMALKGDGTVVVWGAETNAVPLSPSLIQPPGPAELAPVVAIAAGWSHCMALRADGTVAVWGDGSAGQTTVPIGLSNVVAIASGANHLAALRADGTVVSWGLDNFGQTIVPTLLSDAVALALGDGHTTVLQSDGRPHVTLQPANRMVAPGTPVRLTALAVGAQPIAYQWRLNGRDIPGATRTVLYIPPAELRDRSSYDVVVSNARGAETSRQSKLTVLGIEPEIIGISFSGGQATLTWNSLPGRQYRLQASTGLDAKSWIDLPGVVTAIGTTSSATDSTGPHAARFYRIMLVQ